MRHVVPRVDPLDLVVEALRVHVLALVQDGVRQDIDHFPWVGPSVLDHMGRQHFRDAPDLG